MRLTLLAASCAFIALSSRADDAPIVAIDSGRIEGVVGRDVVSFKGVPYAAPPVGEWRWRPPQPVTPWTHVRKADKVREKHPGQVLDVVHADFHANPMAVLERIYAFIGMDICDDTRAAMAKRIEEKPELARGAHRYSIADYGMTEEQAREPFGDYVQRYDLVEKKT